MGKLALFEYFSVTHEDARTESSCMFMTSTMNHIIQGFETIAGKPRNNWTTASFVTQYYCEG